MVAIALAVVAVVVAVAALGTAWRAWPRKGLGEPGYVHERASRGTHWLARAVGALVVLDVMAAGGLGVSLLRKGSGDTSVGSEQRVSAESSTSTTLALRPARAPQTPRSTSTSPPVGSRSAGSTSTSTPGPAASVRLAPPQHGPQPVLLALLPASGLAGEHVTLKGRGFFSKDGQIAVTFGAAQAPVACPSETTCYATVPSRLAKSSGRVEVTVSTETGTSNGLVFKYAVSAASA